MVWVGIFRVKPIWKSYVMERTVEMRREGCNERDDRLLIAKLADI